MGRRTGRPGASQNGWAATERCARAMVAGTRAGSVSGSVWASASVLMVAVAVALQSPVPPPDHRQISLHHAHPPHVVVGLRTCFGSGGARGVGVRTRGTRRGGWRWCWRWIHRPRVPILDHFAGQKPARRDQRSASSHRRKPCDTTERERTRTDSRREGAATGTPP